MAEVEIAGADLDPGVGDADDGAAQLVVVEADSLEHGAGGRAAGAVGDGAAVALEIAVGWRRLVHALAILENQGPKIEGHHRFWMMAGWLRNALACHPLPTLLVRRSAVMRSEGRVGPGQESSISQRLKLGLI